MNTVNDQAQGYAPREGSKVSAALEFLRAGPATASELATVFECAENSVSARMHQAINAELVTRYANGAGKIHYALPGLPAPAGMTPYPPAASAPTSTLAAPTNKATGRRGQSTAGDEFVAALFSNDEFLIQANGSQVRLQPGQLAKLRAYLNRFDSTT